MIENQAPFHQSLIFILRPLAQKIAKAIQKVEIVIVMMSTRPHWNSIISEDFFTYLFKENLAENCRHVVVRITNPPERSKDEETILPMSDGTRSIGKVDPEQIMKWSYGFEKKSVTKAKLCKLQMMRSTSSFPISLAPYNRQ